MKRTLSKCRCILLAAIMMWCVFPGNVYAENGSYCYPTEEQIQAYKEDGTWEKRQEYVKKLNLETPSQELLHQAIQREKGSGKRLAKNHILDSWKGMPVADDAKMLMVRVEFADVKFEDSIIYSEEKLYDMVMGDESTGVFPYESLNAYYKRSSYDKLNITTDQVYSCTLSKDRDAYEWTDTGEQDLIKEVLEMLDSTVDFSDYDANNDGWLDSICINFAGENTGWGSTWWSHKANFIDSSITFDGVIPKGYIFLETNEGEGSYGTQTLIHETGHLLGLPDYYSQVDEGIGTVDMMNNNSGDHNGFSKWLLGWIEEENIQRITSQSGNTEVSLSPLSVEVPEDNKMIAVIAPEDTAVYSEYFVVQYDEYMGNQSVFELERPAYRIYHVDARLNEEGTDFRYDNLYVYEHSLIKAVSIVEGEYAKRAYYMEGDSLTPDTNESSAFYGGDILGFTGIELTDFKTGDSPSFKAAFREKEKVDGKLEFEIVEDMASNMIGLTLVSNKPLIDAGTYQQVYLEDDEGKQYYLELDFEEETRRVNVSYINIADSLKPETEYTLVIPEGMFQVDKDVYSEECRVTIKTGTFPEIEADYQYGAHIGTDIFNLDDTTAGFIQVVDSTDENWFAELHLFEGTEAKEVIDFYIPIPESYTEIMNMKGAACYDGTIALQIGSANPEDYNSISSYYKIDADGNVLAGPFSMVDKLDIFPAGNGIKGVLQISGGLGAPDLENELKLEIYTIDFENEPTVRLVNTQKYMSEVYALDEESYIVIDNFEEGYKASIFNNKDELIQTIDLSAYIDHPVCGVVKTGERLAVMCSVYQESEEYAAMIFEFDMKGTYLGTHEAVSFKEWKDRAGWTFEKTKWGYWLCNYTNEQPYNICFLDDEFKLISTMQVPDVLCSGTHMGSRSIVRWYDLTTWGYRVAITEPIVTEVEEDTGDEEDKGDEQEPERPIEEDGNTSGQDKPTEESGDNHDSKTPAVPTTGDNNNLFMLFLVFVISGGIVVGLRMKK